MSDKITIYQKPTCSKCREAIGILKEQGVEFEAINYYETPVTSVELKQLIEKLGISAKDLLRKGEQLYRDLEIGKRELTDDELIDLMIEHPDLMQRPIVVRGDKAVLARPPENLCELL
jgi:arsenate reductase